MNILKDKKKLILCGILFSSTFFFMTKINTVAPKKILPTDIKEKYLFTNKISNKCKLSQFTQQKSNKEDIIKYKGTFPITDIKKNKREPISKKNKVQKKILKSDFSNAIFIGDSITYEFTKSQNTSISNNRVFARIGAHVFEGKKLLGSNRNDLLKRCNNNVDYVFIMYGANDYGYNMNTYKKWYKELIHHVRSMFPNVKIVIQSVMPMENSYNEPNRSSNPQKLNKIIKNIAIEENVTYLDIASQIPNIRELYLSDGLHFKASLYPLWLKVIKSNIE